MFQFRNDYGEGAHPLVMDALNATNDTTTPGYGTDELCAQARTLIGEQIRHKDADIHFLVGGTQTNQLLISAALRPHQAVISAESGHINVHETGAIEATGHKVLTCPCDDGKLTPAKVEAVLARHLDEHMVCPGMVYISQPTELGTIYSKRELEALAQLCRTRGLFLYVDGARLACGLTAPVNDLFLPDLAELTDAFYIGGTKCGALFGEALVLCNDRIKPDFRYLMKQRGAMLAKGRLLGVQFQALFTDSLYEKIGAHANRMAGILRAGLKEAGVACAGESCTNQLFPILPNEIVETLRGEAAFEWIEPADENRSVIRFVTGWATRQTQAEAFAARLKELCGR